jgi:hypothetical protein
MTDFVDHSILANLPANVRAAIDAQDADAFQCAIDELPKEEAAIILRQLEAAGIIGVGLASEEAFQAMLQEFDLLIQAIVSVARGDDRRRDEVSTVLPKLDEAGYHLGRAVPLLWAGERQLSVLTEGIDPNSARLVEHILSLINGDTNETLSIDIEAIAAFIPAEVLNAIQAQDETAFQQAMDALEPARRQFVAQQLARLQAQADTEAETWLASLPINIRLAVLDQDALRLQAALQELPAAQAQEILSQLEAADLLGEPIEPQADLQMSEFEPLALAVAAVARGDSRARLQLEALLADLEEQGWHLSSAIQRIWAGERDLQILSDGLEPEETQIIHRILSELG